MTSAPGLEVADLVIAQRRLNIQPVYVLPGSQSHPSCLISSRHGVAMEAGPMEDLCAELMKLEQLFIGCLLTMNNSIPNDLRASQRDKVKAWHGCHDLSEIHEQMEEVSDRKYRFHEKYPEDRYLGWYWWGCLDTLCDFRSSKNPDLEQLAHDFLERVENQIHMFETQLVKTAGHIELSPEIRGAIQHKWMKLIEGLAMHRRLFGTSMRCQTWHCLSTRIGRVKCNVDTTATSTEKARSSAKLFWILCSTCASTFLVSVLTFSMAGSFSSTTHGTTSDADFWLLLQAAGSQFCALLVTGLTLWKNASKWLWLPIGVGLTCSIAGTVLYCLAPPFAGVMVNAIAGFIQAFLVLLGAIAEYNRHFHAGVEERMELEARTRRQALSRYVPSQPDV